MKYQDELTSIFGNRAPRSLRTLFDVDSKEWGDTTIEVKQKYLLQMLIAQPLNFWIDQYKIQYKTTHPHILEAIERSLNILKPYRTVEQIMNRSHTDLIVDRVLREIQFETKLDEEYFYSNIPFCVIDSIYSIGVRYEGVKNVITTVSSILNIPVAAKFIDGVRQDEITTTSFISKISHWTVEEMASELYKNKQRTSTSNGILKAEAALLFMQVLAEYKVEKFSDLQNIYNNIEFENAIRAIKGQSSGISLKYFYMLAGNGNMIKPDRMIMRFLEETLGQRVNTAEAQDILFNAAAQLSEKLNTPINAMLLDNHIWKYQRQKD